MRQLLSFLAKKSLSNVSWSGRREAGKCHKLWIHANCVWNLRCSFLQVRKSCVPDGFSCFSGSSLLSSAKIESWNVLDTVVVLRVNGNRNNKPFGKNLLLLGCTKMAYLDAGKMRLTSGGFCTRLCPANWEFVEK